MRKLNKKIKIMIATIIIVLLLTLFFVFTRNDEKDSNGVVWNGKQNIEKQHEQSSIAIPGFNEISFLSDSINQKVNLYNPESNNCTMNFSIIMPDGTVIWEEENIQPGYGLYDIKLNQKLEKGTYERCVFTVRCFRDGTELNGCNITFTMYVY